MKTNTCKNPKCQKQYDKERLKASLGEESPAYLLGYCSAFCYTKCTTDSTRKELRRHSNTTIGSLGSKKTDSSKDLAEDEWKIVKDHEILKSPAIMQGRKVIATFPDWRGDSFDGLTLKESEINIQLFKKARETKAEKDKLLNALKESQSLLTNYKEIIKKNTQTLGKLRLKDCIESNQQLINSTK